MGYEVGATPGLSKQLHGLRGGSGFIARHEGMNLQKLRGQVSRGLAPTIRPVQRILEAYVHLGSSSVYGMTLLKTLRAEDHYEYMSLSLLATMHPATASS